MGDLNEDEVIIENENISVFDEIVGAIEDIVVDEKFQDLQAEILEKYFHHFDDSEENKLIYTEIFEVYTAEIEAFIEAELSERVPHFSMDTFLRQLKERRHDLDGDIFEMLYTLSDFLAFKEMFLEYAMMKKSVGPDLSGLLSVSSFSIN